MRSNFYDCINKAACNQFLCTPLLPSDVVIGYLHIASRLLFFLKLLHIINEVFRLLIVSPWKMDAVS